MTHCTSFFQMSSGRKAKFSTATTSSGTNGMLFLLGTLGGHQLQYHCRSTVGGRGNYLPNCQFEASFLLVQWICAQSKLSSIMMSLSRATSGRLLGVFTQYFPGKPFIMLPSPKWKMGRIHHFRLKTSNSSCELWKYLTLIFYETFRLEKKQFFIGSIH